MTYRANGTEFTLQPTSGRWLPRNELGRNGYGHPVYPATREFEITWAIKSAAEANQIQTFFDALSNTGTVVMDLPRYAYATYEFFAYTGCIIGEPELGTYFVENYQNVRLLVTNIRT